MKKITKIYISLVFSLVFALAFSFSTFGSEERFIDEHELFSDSERASLNDLLCEKSAGCAVEFYIYVYEEDIPWQNYVGEDFLVDYGFDDGDALVLLTLKRELGEWYCDIYTYGSAYTSITDAEVDYLCEDGGIFDAIKTRDAFDGLKEYVDFVGRAVEKNALPLGRRITAPLILALILALAVSGGIVFSYKRKVRSDSYPLKEFTNLDLNYSRDDFAGSFVTRRHAPRNNGSSRSGGGGGGRGGGGGHRGGR